MNPGRFERKDRADRAEANNERLRVAMKAADDALGITNPCEGCSDGQCEAVKIIRAALAATPEKEPVDNESLKRAEALLDALDPFLGSYSASQRGDETADPIETMALCWPKVKAAMDARKGR